MPHLRYKSEIEPPKTNPLVANGYNGLPPHMQPHLRHPSKSVPTLNSDGNDSHVPADKPYPQPVTQLPHSRTSSTTSIPRSVAESVKQMYPNHKGPEGLPPNGHYYSGFQPPPGSPSIPMTPPMYVQHQNATRPEIGYGNASMTLPTYPHSAARMSDKDKLKMQVNGIQPHLQSATSRIQPSKSVPTLNSDQEIPRPIGQPYAITTSTNVIPRYIAQQQHQQQLLKMNRPPESDQWPGRYPNTQIMQQLQQQQQPPSSPTAQMSPMYNSNHSRPNSQLSMQSQPHHRNSYQSSYPEERHYQNVQNLNMHHLHANNTYQNAENTMNVSQPPMNVHPQHLPPPVPPQHQPQRLQQQPQVHPHYQQHLQQIPPPLPPHQQPQYNHSVPNHHMQSQLQPHQMQQIQQQKLYQQQLLQHQRLQRLKLEELRRQQELQLAHQAEERLLRDAKRRQEEEPRLQRPQQLRFELPNSEHNEDIPPPLPKSPPPVENNPQQRLERLLLSSASASNESLPVRSANKSKEPLNQNSKPKVSWTDSTPTVLNLETNATNNGPVNNVHSFTLQDIDEVLDIEDDPEFNDRFTAGNTPNVIGAQEVYRDPRDRIKAEKMRHEAQKTELKVPEKLSFKEKMKMFAMEDNTPKDKLKISKAQREIETGPSPAKDETCDDSSQEVNS
ncbi:hypothetical protein B4U80_00464 [Leptotrombidium deliense]|uniref:Uncharacterized protein n=1 Tax=Leptotrombidium deliense TaxID=299467 RepID=A0A443SN30_9ACAR|nr:hypothetical protein B4U80_00464 [Leptotrombidium deliense]